MFAIGNKVKVRTKLHGVKEGTIVASEGVEQWIVFIPDHWRKRTVALERDMKHA